MYFLNAPLTLARASVQGALSFNCGPAPPLQCQKTNIGKVAGCSRKNQFMQMWTSNRRRFKNPLQLPVRHTPNRVVLGSPPEPAALLLLCLAIYSPSPRPSGPQASSSVPSRSCWSIAAAMPSKRVTSSPKTSSTSSFQLAGTQGSSAG